VSAAEVIEKIKHMPVEDWLRIQSGIGELLASSFNRDETQEIEAALAEADSEIARGATLNSEEMRRHFGLHSQ
jgi:hypothetical protein